MMSIFCAVTCVVFILVLIRIIAKLTCARCHSKVCLVGQTALVTGGSSGIGYQIVLNLASRGCKVIVADKVVNENLKLSVKRETKNSNVIFEYVDLASFKSVRKLAEKLNKSEDKLDILINNAGVAKSPNELTEDGLNPTMQINYYSGYLLTHLLVGLLKKSPSGRIIFTNSLNSYFHRISLNNIGKTEIMREKYAMFDYFNSKFCMLVASDILAKKLKSYNITSNCYHPGIVKTPIVKIFYQECATFWERIAMLSVLFIVFLVGKNQEDGAEIAVHLATSEDVKDVTGKFFLGITPFIKPRGATNRKLCEKIWKLSENIVQLESKERLK